MTIEYLIAFIVYVVFVGGLCTLIITIDRRKMSRHKKEINSEVDKIKKEAYDQSLKLTTNYEKIQNMSVDEMAKLLNDVYNAGWFDGHTDDVDNPYLYSQKWLESEVEYET